MTFQCECLDCGACYVSAFYSSRCDYCESVSLVSVPVEGDDDNSDFETLSQETFICILWSFYVQE